jgi:hypothetical protein
MLRNNIRSLAAGNPVPHPTDEFSGILPTYAGDTMLRIPLQQGRDDAAVLKEISFKVADIFRASDDKSGSARKKFIQDELKKYEAGWA